MRPVQLSLLLSILTGGCESTAPSPNPSPVDASADAPAVASPDAACVSGTLCPPPAAEYWTFATEPFTVPPNSERFLCFAKELDEDLTIDAFEYTSKPVFHHVLFAETLSPEPDGFTECDVLFRTTWLPMYVAGSTGGSLAAPPGAGYQLEKGSQLMAQLHLLNPTQEPITDTFELRLRKSPLPSVNPIGIVVFGSTEFQLPAKRKSSIEGLCTAPRNWDIFAVFPHMHYLGRSLTFELGPSPGPLTEVFARHDYDFDDQRMDLLDLNIAAGDTARVTCEFDNPYDHTVEFGESSLSEMCFLISYAVGTPDRLEGCFDGGPGGLIPPGCGKDPPNDKGIGTACTKGGGECPEDLACTLDLVSYDIPGFCILPSCATQADCGAGASCCALQQAGGFTICVPDACWFAGCAAP
jgi:hypothetical protein